MKKRMNVNSSLRPKSTEVVAAVLVKDNKILIAQRAKNDVGGGLWEFPGGKREAKESREQALRREIEEELSLEIKVEKCFGEQEFSHGEKNFNLILFLCSIVGGEPILHEHRDVRWVMPHELQAFDFSQPDIPFVEIVGQHFLTNLVK